MKHLTIITLIILVTAFAAVAQTNEFTYQGKLTDSAGTAATYDLQLGLYIAPSGGTPLGTRDRLGVPVTNGTFTVRLDFPAAAFSGGDRWLEIRVKAAGSTNPHTVLSPRQQIISSPYAIYSAEAANAETADFATNATNSNKLGGVNADQFVQTTDTRLSDSRNPLPGSASYIQNRSIVQAGTTNFNINGSGTIGTNLTVLGTLNANLPPADTSYIQNRTFAQVGTANFNISGTGTANIFNAATQFNLGGSRVLSAPGSNNTFVGKQTGTANTGVDNSFFGFNAGSANTTGGDNAFFGSDAGGANTIGVQNSFFGSDSGDSNTTGNANSFFGRNSGTANTNGTGNVFVGFDAGSANTSGFRNTFIGAQAGTANTIGTDNTAIGAGAGNGPASGGRSFSTAIGAGAVADFSNLIVLGRPSGVDSVVMWGPLSIPIGTGGATPVCSVPGYFSVLSTLKHCSSSLRYKTNIAGFTTGLELVNRLKPITFNWKEGGLADLGLGAEDVATIEPLLVTYDKDGQVEGVKYDRIGVVLINAVKEQQAQIANQQEENQKQNVFIDSMQKQLQQQQIVINKLRKLVCSQNPQTEVCRNRQ